MQAPVLLAAVANKVVACFISKLGAICVIIWHLTGTTAWQPEQQLTIVKILVETGHLSTVKLYLENFF